MSGGREIAWMDVVAGDTVMGKDGKNWTVAAVDPTPSGETEFTLQLGKRSFKHTPDVMATVFLVFESLSRVVEKDRELDEAIAIAGLYLGGEVVAHQDTEDGPWKVQASGWTLPDLHSHLTIFHGLGQAGRPANATLSELEKFHLKMHDTRAAPTPHVHSDAPFRKGGRVSWK